MCKPDSAFPRTVEYRPQGYKKNSCSTGLSMKFIPLINAKMPTIAKSHATQV